MLNTTTNNPQSNPANDKRAPKRVIYVVSRAIAYRDADAPQLPPALPAKLKFRFRRFVFSGPVAQR
jgi:hypothetical protein